MKATTANPSSILSLVALVVAYWLTTYAVHSSVQLGFAWLASRRLDSHRAREIIWRLALLSGIVTSSIQTAAMVASLTDMSEPNPTPLQVINDEDWVSAEMHLTEGAIDQPPISTVEAKPSALTPSDDLFRMTTSTASWIILAWGAGMALFGARLAVQVRRFHAAVGSRQDVTDSHYLAMLDDLLQPARLRRCRLTMSDRISSPLAIGLREICLPVRALTDLNAEQQKNLMAHEIAHLVRRDTIWLIGVNLLRAILFFQPILAVALRHIQDEAEFMCDDWAIAHTHNRVGLARCLVEVAGWVASPKGTIAVTMRGNPSILEQRVRRMLDSSHIKEPKMNKRYWVMIVAGICAFVFSGYVSSPIVIDVSAQDETGELLEELAMIGDATGIAIGDPDAPVTLIELVDFSCPFCQDMSPVVDRIIDRYGTTGNVRVVLIPVPLLDAPYSDAAARATLCAGEAGYGWDMIEGLWETDIASDPSGYEETQITELAESIGLDADEFAACLASEETTESLANSMEEAQSRGVVAVPTFFVNDVKTPHWGRCSHYDTLASAIDAALESAGIDLPGDSDNDASCIDD